VRASGSIASLRGSWPSGRPARRGCISRAPQDGVHPWTSSRGLKGFCHVVVAADSRPRMRSISSSRATETGSAYRRSLRICRQFKAIHLRACPMSRTTSSWTARSNWRKRVLASGAWKSASPFFQMRSGRPSRIWGSSSRREWNEPCRSLCRYRKNSTPCRDC